jgi:hypothetical protein
MRLFESRCRQALHRFDCPGPDTLRDYAWQFLPSERRQQVKEHLAKCPACSAELEALDELLKVKDADSLGKALARARSLAQEARLTIARILSPTSLQTAPALRGETQKVLLFAPEQGDSDADGMALSVNLEREETGNCTLFGQLLSTDQPLPSGSHARLTRQGGQTEPVQATLDVHGGFALADIPAGVYQLVVDLGVQRIIVPNLSLGQVENV